MPELHSREDRLSFGLIDIVRLIRDDEAYANANLRTHRQARAKPLVQQVADYWGFTSELAEASLETLGDITGIRTVEQARAAAFQDEAERRRERLEDNVRMDEIRRIQGSVKFRAG